MKTNKDILCSMIDENRSKKSIKDFIMGTNCIKFFERNDGELLLIDQNQRLSLTEWSSMHKKKLRDSFNNDYRRMMFLGISPVANFDWLGGFQEKVRKDFDVEDFLEKEDCDGVVNYYWRNTYDGIPRFFRYLLEIYDPIPDLSEGDWTYEDILVKE